ncbi:flagellar basal body P-ring formation chaperone FlgA [Brevundimonas lutea]|uniref:flagellar basal body P-ring formation chaperone FlgA n=1 Tax=Brevundimonas lutea TaxID=2293980 RepID=UPI000F02B672|nr:flagellar basal body P-ring formation chaperone FlgA [Brevundimonas lutea]
MIRVLFLIAALLMAAPAFAGPVEMWVEPTDDDGRVTLSDLFPQAGSAGDTLIARRSGPTVVLDARMVQTRARAAGLDWANTTGLRRIVVRAGAEGVTPASAAGQAAASVSRPGATVEALTYVRSLRAGDIVRPEDVAWSEVQAHLAQAGGPQDAEAVIGLSARRALRAGAPVQIRDLTAPQVIKRNDLVQVAFIQSGVRLTITGRAMADAAVGENFPVRNTTSDRTIEAVATAPGQAVVGAAARQARTQQFAALR